MDKLNKILALLTELIKNKFYGKVEITLEAGNIIIVRKNETIKV